MENKLIKEKLKQSFLFFKYRKDDWGDVGQITALLIQYKEIKTYHADEFAINEGLGVLEWIHSLKNGKNTFQNRIYEIIQVNLALNQAVWNDLLRFHLI